jgi:cell division protein FtsI (penicillin-binding protein 3)
MVLSVFAGRLIQLQGFDPGAYAAAAAASNLVDVTLPATRGEITDRNGKPLADSVDGMAITADPSLVASDEAPKLATFLANKLGVDYATTLAALRKPDSRFQYIARRVPATKATAVLTEARAQGFNALYSQRDPIREYPAHDVAANIVGFMGTDGALGGVEHSFDGDLAGTDGKESYEVAADGTRLPLGASSTVAPTNGSDIKLTIDSDVQWYVQRVLRQVDEENGALNGMAVVIDTKTGEVLALADDPTFDADDPTASPAADLGARSLSEVYEPGSVEKTLTISSLIDAGKVTDTTREVIPPVLNREDTTIHDWFSHGVLHYTLAGVIAQSSNIGTVLAADRFGDGQLHSYLTKFGLGQRTGVGIEGESPGILPTMKQWNHEIQDRIAFGQSVSVNALQMAAAVNTIANGGVYVSPSLVMGSATTDSGAVVGTDTTKRHRVISKKAATEMMKMMERVPDPATGTAPGAQVPGYRVAGKTGTAQRVNPSCGCYVGGGYTVSFVGFAPADKPRFTVYVVINRPRNESASGGGTAGPAFSKIMSYVLRKYGVPPTNTQPSHLPTTW